MSSRRLAYAVLRGDPPTVYAADDLDTLHRVVALQAVASTPAHTVPSGPLTRIRAALLDERWGDAVVEWIEVTGVVVDVYDNALEVWSADRLAEPELDSLELQLRPLFSDQR